MNSFRLSRVVMLKSICLSAALAVAAPMSPAQSAPAEELMQKGNTLDSQLKAEDALECYQQVEKMDPDNATVMVRIARQYRHLMADAKTNAEKLRLGGMAVSYGKKAAALAPNDSDAQLSTAISYGKMVPYLSTKEQMASSRIIKEGADKAIKLNGRNDLAWHISGRWHRNLAEIGTVKRALAAIVYGKLPEATHQEACDCFETAVKINPNRVIHHIELGRTYAEMGRNEEARKCIEKGLSLPSTEKDDEEAKERGRETLAGLP